MVIPATVTSPSSTQLMEQLGRVCTNRGLPDLATRLQDLQRWIQGDLSSIEADLAVIRRGKRMVQNAAHHLLELRGKHLRPLCVALASKLGAGFSETARQLAVSVELVHTATLLHDDVIDLGETRRGAPTARVMYGNAASIFAGNWLLIEALRRIRKARVPGILDYMLDIIDEMILAESLQLEQRGRVHDNADIYFRVVEGKTAALFRWALFAGGRAAGLGDADCDALERCGLHLGVAFQAIDDCLDFGHSGDTIGKAVFADLSEGKATYPLIVAMQRDAALRPLLQQALADTAEGQALPETVKRSVIGTLERTGALADCRALAFERIQLAIESLSAFPDGPAKVALITVAEATAHREK